MPEEPRGQRDQQHGQNECDAADQSADGERAQDRGGGDADEEPLHPRTRHRHQHEQEREAVAALILLQPFRAERAEQAAGRVREAFLAVARAGIAAPVSGYVAKRAVQVGKRIQPGAPLMTVVPLDELWVDANFKESQLRRLRIGQPVTLEADLYGGTVEYRGRVAGLAAGTGSVFSLLPAQNATGNWIKVVQRVPVRILIDSADLRRHPLRIGLSATVHVDTSQCDRKAPAQPPMPEETRLYAVQKQAADRVAAAALARSLAAAAG
jgi:membrane fusion protein (multidrug efflux system)